MKIKGNNFLVTGGAGFIGSHLVDMLLEKGANKVIVFDNFIRGNFNNLKQSFNDNHFELFNVKGDLLHSDELKKATLNIDGVFHLASLCLPHCQEYPRSSLDVNIVGTYNLLEACVDNSISKVVFASSSSVYGNATYSPMDENHPFENRNFYGASKIAGEAIIKAFYYKFGLQYVSLRFMNVYGPRQDQMGAYIAVIIKIIEKLYRNQPPIIYGDGSQSFDFINVEDACRSCIVAMESEKTDSCYNISTGRQVSIKKLSQLLIELMGKNIQADFKEINDNTLVTNRIGSIEKAERELGFKAQISLESGLKELIEWYINTNK